MGWMRKREIRRRILSQIEGYANSWFGNGSFGHERQIHHSQAKKGCKIPSRNGVNVSTTTLILATWTTTSNYFLPICVQCAENGERELFFESDIVLNLWKYSIFYEVSPTKVSSLSFKTTMKTYVLTIVYLKEMELKNLMQQDISHRIIIQHHQNQ